VQIGASIVAHDEVRIDAQGTLCGVHAPRPAPFLRGCCFRSRCTHCRQSRRRGWHSGWQRCRCRERRDRLERARRCRTVVSRPLMPRLGRCGAYWQGGGRRQAVEATRRLEHRPTGTRTFAPRPFASRSSSG
jgi:hypothetical protein